MHERIFPRICTCVGLVLLLPACLDRNGGGNIDTTMVELTTDGGTTGTAGTSTTYPEIMTTTLEPDDTSTSSSGSSDSSTTEDPMLPNCGDGKLDPGEECDDGDANADDAACTSTCNQAVCGDGLVRAGVEACDDGGDNGEYGKCADGCKSMGPRCGDGELQMDQGEYCDQASPDSGCLKECTWATSCLQLKESWGDEAGDGLYVIHRMSQFLTVWCVMSADGGGYTVLKHAGGALHSAKDAQQVCSSQYGMQLMVPRSSAHITSLAAVAASPDLGPANNQPDGDAQSYLRIFGIYPVEQNKSCAGQPLNSTACPQWKAADTGPFWVTGTALDPGQPSNLNCLGCSMEYFWDMTDPPTVAGYAAFTNGNIGATSTHFMCDVGDKKGP